MMYIRELRLEGFQLFHEATKPLFDENPPAVSGPNDSRRSHLVDVVLFTLGLPPFGRQFDSEQDSLLSHASEFEPVEEASVEVVFDNSDGAIEAEELGEVCGSVENTDEVMVRRRLNRTSEGYESHYSVNGQTVDLHDLLELLEFWDLTASGYNVLAEEDIEGAGGMARKESREVAEDAAEVKRNDEKRRAAEEKLEVVEERIEKLNPVLEELDERIGRLERELVNGLTYRELKEAKTRLTNLLEVLRDGVDSEADSASSIAKIEEEIDRLEREIEELEPVSMLAPEEYFEELERRGDLVRRRNLLYLEKDLLEHQIQEYEQQEASE